jgi:GDPmannose 4,6-dehydratase
MKIIWKGKSYNEKGYWNNLPIIHVDKRYFRPTEVNSLMGDSTLAKKDFKWKPKYKISNLIDEMVEEELKS